MVDDRRLLLPTGRLLDERSCEKLLVERRGHLGHKDGVVVVLERLAASRVVAVHGVARLVGQREYVVEHVGLVVHQDIRIGVKRPTAKGSALLAGVRIPIGPSALQPPLEHSTVLLPQRSQRIHNDRDGLVPTPMRLGLGQDRYIRVIMMDVVKLHLAASHIEIRMNGRQMVSHSCDQVIVYGHRYVVGKERGLQRAWIVPRPGVVDVGMDTASQSRC